MTDRQLALVRRFPACYNMPDAHAEAFDAVMKEFDRLAAVVEKLPIDVDGDPLLPNTEYWW